MGTDYAVRTIMTFEQHTTSKTPANLAEDRGLKLRQSFLKHPVESPDVDYKFGEKFGGNNDFSLELVRHILGMANAGGGFIVIGYKENKNKHPEPIPNLSQEVIGSYDPSDVANLVESYKVGSEKISLAIHKDPHPDTKTVYPIIEVHGFKTCPFFCSKNAKDKILEKGALYIRIASARTIKVASPDEWNQLIDLCIENKQADLLKRFAALLQEMGVSSAQIIHPKNEKKIDIKWVEENRKDFVNYVSAGGLNKDAYYEASHFLLLSSQTWNVQQLIEAARKSALRNTGWPVGYVPTSEYRPKPTGDGIKTVIPGGDMIDAWNLRTNGSFYFARTYGEEEFHKRNIYPPRTAKPFYFDTRIWRTAEILLHCVHLYKNLGIDPSSKIQVKITHNGLKGRELTASNFRRSILPHTSIATESVWEKEVSLDFLETNYRQLTKEVVIQMFALFDFMVFDEPVLDNVIDEFLNSRV